MVDLNMTRLGFVFVLISLFHMHDVAVVHSLFTLWGDSFELDVQSQGGGRILDVDGLRRNMYIIPK